MCDSCRRFSATMAAHRSGSDWASVCVRSNMGNPGSAAGGDSSIRVPPRPARESPYNARAPSRRIPMNGLLALSRAIDAMNERIGQWVTWLVLAAVVVSALNAIVRKAFDMSSNAFLEIQWYLFSGVFLLCAAWTLLRNEHIRIDVVAGRLSKRTQTWIDVLGTIFFLFPMAGLILYEAIPWAWRAVQSGEISSSAGGLILWPAKILVPIGFALLILQGIS